MNKKKIFISSVQSEFQQERRALVAYIRQDALLSRYFEPFLFEELPAQDQSAQRAYLDEAAKDEVYLLLVGEQYGYEDEQGVSPTEREFDAASANHAYRIAMLKRTTNRHPKEQRFADKVDKEVIRNTFDSVEELKSGLYAALVEYMMTHGLTIAKLSQSHNSMPQNPILAHPVYLAGYIEQIGTGTTDIVELCRQEGLQVEFKQEGDFTTIIHRPTGQVREQAGGQTGEQAIAQVVDLEDKTAGQVGEQVRGQVGDQVTSQVKNPMERIVLTIGEQKLTRQEIMDALCLKGIRNFRENYLEPSIRLGYVNMLYSGASNHPNQAYYLTKKGLALYHDYVAQTGKEIQL